MHARAFDNEEDSDREQVDIKELLACKVTALPPIKKKFKPMRPMLGVSYLATSGLYEEMVGKRRR